jgi:Outer membrane protein beta-barrel domain
MKIFQTIVIMVLAASALFAQPREGKNKELSLSGCYQNYSSGSGSETSGAFLLSPRLGFYVVKGLELEPEILLMFSSGTDPIYMFNGNVCYNFISQGKGVPFILIGYGISNTVPFFNVPFTRTSFSIGVFNLGAGVKAYMNEDVALRLEYRYQRFSSRGTTTTYGDYSYSQEVNTRIHTIQFGLSVLL